MTAIPIIIGALRTVGQGSEWGLGELEIGGRTETIIVKIG